MPAQPQALSFGFARVRRAVGAEEEFGRARRRRLAHRQPVLLALGDRQAISMRPQAAGEHRVAVDDQMLRRDRRGDDRRLSRMTNSAASAVVMCSNTIFRPGKSRTTGSARGR